MNFTDLTPGTAARIPTLIISKSLGMGIISKQEMRQYRDVQGHDVWFEEIANLLDADRHTQMYDAREDRCELALDLDLYRYARRQDWKCGLC